MKDVLRRGFAAIAACVTVCVPVAADADIGAAVGDSHVLVVTGSGVVWAWGVNTSGQIGDGTTTTRKTPVSLSISNVAKVAAGTSFSLALKTDGTVWAWGQNTYGQLGDGTTTQRTSAVQVSGLSNVVAIAAGNSHSVALKADGTIWAWGRNNQGQIGDGTQTNRSTAVQVSSLSTYGAAIAADNDFSSAAKSDGSVWGWGINSSRQLGDGTTTSPRTSPVQTGSLSSITSVGAGESRGFAWTSGGALSAWGNNTGGALGDGTLTPRSSPVSITGISNVIALRSGGMHTVAVKSDGSVMAWGDNGSGQVGDGTTTDRTSPISLSGPADVVAVGARGYNSIVVSSDGRVWTWGTNSQWQVGDGTTEARNTPTQISDAGFAWRVATPVISSDTGTYSNTFNTTITCVTSGATIRYTTNGQDPTSSDTSIASGGTISITQTTTLKVKAFKSGMPDSNTALAVYTMVVPTPTYSLASGTYTSAQSVTLSLSLGSTTIRYTTDGSTPTASSSLYSTALTIATTTILKAVGFRTGWTESATGSRTYTLNYGTLGAPTFTPVAGQYGYGQQVSLQSDPLDTIRYTTDGSTPDVTSSVYTAPLTLTGTVTIKARAFRVDWTQSSASEAAYTVKVATPTFSPGAGSYSAGQTITISNVTPSSVIHYTTNGLEPTESDPVIATGGTVVAGNYTLKAKAWRTGWTSSDVQTAAYTLSGTVPSGAAAAGDQHSVVMRGDGLVWTWGVNSGGQLGDGTTTSRSVPGLINGLTGIIAVASGETHVVALSSAGSVVTWGRNTHGELGDGTTTNRPSPTTVSGLSGVVAIGAGKTSSYAVKSDGTLWAWGENDMGQLGDGTTTNRTSPVQVSGLSGMTSVAGGEWHALARKSDGTVWSWGRNLEGQLGDTTTTQRLTPVQMSLGSSTATTIGAGRLQSWVVLSNGTAWGAGWNALGEVGVGFTSGAVSTPAQVVSASALAQVQGGELHGVGLRADGGALSWGLYTHGRLGDGSTANRSTPAAVSSLTSVVSLGAGHAHNIAVTSNGTVWAWGYNIGGQLGDGTLDDRLYPVKISEAAFDWKTSTPRLSPDTGSYSAITNVTVTAVTAGAVIHYTTNGTDPTESDPTVASGSTVTVDQSMVLKAAAWATSMPGSNPASATYTMVLPAPSASPGAGTYLASQSVTLSSSVTGTSIRYTTDGSTPTSSSTLATGAIAIDVTTTLKAIGFKSGWTDSSVTTAPFTLKVVPPTMSPSGGGFSSSQTVTISTTTPSTTITYTTNGSEPLATSTTYTGAVNVGATMTLKAKGWRTGWTGSDSGAASFWITQGTAATPTFTPTGGTYTLPPWITLASATTSAAIHYTVDGTDPTTASAAFAWPLAIGTTTTVKARAFVPGYTPSAVASATFSVDETGAVATPTLTPTGGWLAAGRDVTVSVATSGATIRYTTTGVDPVETDATVTSGNAVTIDRSAVLKVKAWKSGLTASAVRRTDFAVIGAVASGSHRSYALKGDGSVRAWGSNDYGQLGDGTTQDRLTPVTVSGLTTVVSIAGGEDHAVAVKRDGSVWAWGKNTFGQVGDGTTTTRTTPVQVTGLSNVVAVAAGRSHSLAITADGAVWAWGRNNAGQLGDGTATNRSAPVAVPGLHSVVRLAAGYEFSLAIEKGGASDGIVWAWGDNSQGQLGDGSYVSRSSPVVVAALDHITGIAAGDDFALAVKTDGTVASWGNNDAGQLGDGTTVSRPMAASVPGLDRVFLISAGTLHVLAASSDGRVWSWGSNTVAQLGDAGIPSAGRRNPNVLATISAVVAIEAGGSHSVAVKADGTVWAWGTSAWGAIGDGTTTQRETPVSVSSLAVADNTWLTGDPDEDSLTTWREYVIGTDPLNADTGGTGLGDRVLESSGSPASTTDLDGDGVPNAVELERGTNPLNADTDGDEVSDALDAFPLDPTRSQAPAFDPNDHTPPVITLTEPTNAVPLP